MNGRGKIKCEVPWQWIIRKLPDALTQLPLMRYAKRLYVQRAYVQRSVLMLPKGANRPLSQNKSLWCIITDNKYHLANQRFYGRVFLDWRKLVLALLTTTKESQLATRSVRLQPKASASEAPTRCNNNAFCGDPPSTCARWSLNIAWIINRASTWLDTFTKQAVILHETEFPAARW